MAAQFYTFRLGDFRCTVIQDEDHPTTLKDFFSGVDDPAMQKRLEDNPDEVLKISYNPLLIDTGTQKILIDTGNGLRGWVNGRLLAHLDEMGVPLDQIDVVVLTHAHADHFVGMLTPTGEKVFPKATYMMWRDEWEYATHPDQLKTSFERGETYWDTLLRYFLPLYPRLQFLDAENPTIAEGITAFYAPGHTKHHIAVTLESGGEALMNFADAFLHPLHLENPTWKWSRAHDQDSVIPTNHALIDWIIAHEAMVLGYHFPFPGLGTLHREGENLTFAPVRT